MAPQSMYLSFIAIIMCCAVPVALGQATNFTGPGYIACPFEVDETVKLDFCQGVEVDPSCTAEEINTCNATMQETIPDESNTKLLVPIPCCFTFVSCSNECVFSSDKIPTLPPLGLANFSGIGSLTCPLDDFNRATDCVTPKFVGGNISSCGTCDPYNVSFTEPQPDDEYLTLPLVCDCVIITCPDTCNFTKATSGTSSVNINYVSLTMGFITTATAISLFF